MWLLLALITAVFWAIGNVLIKKGVGQMPKNLIYFSNAAIFLLAELAIWLGSGRFNLNWHTGLWAMLPGLGFIYALTAFSKAEASLVVAVGSIYPAITAFLAVSFLGEKLNSGQGLLIAAVILGAIIMGWPHSARGKPGNWLMWGLGYSLLSGVFNFTSKLGITRTDVLSFSVMAATWQMVYGIIWLSLRKNWRELVRLFSKKDRVGLAGTAVYNLGTVAYFGAVGLGQVSLVMPVVNLSMPLIIFFAWWWLKEKMTKQQMLGAGIILAGVILLSLIS